MAKGLFGRKIGMTQVFDVEGQRIPVTVLEVGPCPVLRVKTEAGPDGYNALVIGFGAKKQKQVIKPEAGLFAKAGVAPVAHIGEMRITAEEAGQLEAGMVLDASAFQAGQVVDISGKTKGRGFTGVIKRHNMHMPKASHGTHEVFRHGGSLGMRTTPGRVWLGKKMAGHYGTENVTIQNLTIHAVEPEKNLVVVKGSVPGPNGALLWIAECAKPAKKKAE